MMQAVREYLHADSQMAYHLWVLMFPIVWATLEKQQQAALAKPIIALLSKEYHQKQTTHRPNIVQVGATGYATAASSMAQYLEKVGMLGRRVGLTAGICGDACAG
jgi:transformation/transcription domain-associated protein